MDCVTSTAKYILLILNIFLSIAGVATIAYGALILSSIGLIEVKGQVGFPPQALLPIILITLGSIIVFISFLGCCDAIRESVCMTMSYAFLMLVLLVLQLTVVILFITHKEKITNALEEFTDLAWKSDVGKASGAFEVIQESFKCCGNNGFTDYALNGIFELPSSCCDGSCLLPTNFYGGCRSKFVKFLSGDNPIVMYVGLGVMVVELVGFIFACCLANNVRNHKRRSYY